MDLLLPFGIFDPKINSKAGSNYRHKAIFIIGITLVCKGLSQDRALPGGG